MLPPVSDRDGNAYVLYGALDLAEVQLFVGHAGGGWTGSCAITYGNVYGAHGFVGRAQGRAWYWSGEALVGATGSTGSCRRLLETDPASGARLSFRAVVPWVRETPSRTTTLAWVQALTDPVPYQVVVDLDNGVYSSLERFSPADATDIAILGVGGSLDEQEGVVVVRYTSGTVVRTQARFINGAGQTDGHASLSGLDTLPEYGITGYLQPSAAGMYAGLDSEGQLVVLDRSGGRRVAVGGMTPAGVHLWDGQLYLVGEAGGRPKVAKIHDDGSVGKIRTWSASEAAAENLGGKISVVDDRSLPSRTTKWQGVRTAMGSFPFLHAHRLDHYADGTTGWLVAGPGFSASGQDYTAIAYVPVGVSYE